MLPLAADRCVHGDIVRGLRRRVPGIDLVTVDEAGLDKRTPDPEILEWAAKEGRVLITQDENTMVGYAWDRVKAGQFLPGVVVCGKGVTIGRAIGELELIGCCGAPEDFKDQVQFLPL
jgi:hypothetical protein